MVNAQIKRQMKRVVRRVAPRLADRLKALLTPTPPSADIALKSLIAPLRDAQLAFDSRSPSDGDALAKIAKDSAVIVVGDAPFQNVALLVDELESEKIVIGELVIVDATAEEPRLVAIRDHVASWSRRLPLTRFTVVPYSRQELRFADAVQQGWEATERSYVWIAGRHNVPLTGCFEYLIKTLIDQKEQAVVVAHTAGPDGQLRRGTLDAGTLSEKVRVDLSVTDKFDLLNDLAISAPRALSGYSLTEEIDSFGEGIFGGARSLLAPDAQDLLDSRFITDIAVADLALRLNARTRIVRTTAALGWSMRSQGTDAATPWEAIHDWRWLLDKRAVHLDEPDRIELVCPFHRGDVILAVQVAAHAVTLGKKIRLHVASPLVAWAKEFGPDLDIQPLPVPVASAEDTYPLLLSSFKYVTQRMDSAPRLARCHPTRGLSQTGQNLVEYMLEEVGLPKDTRLPNVRPHATAEQGRVAEQIMGRFGRDVVFVHPFGGWGLKSIPEHIMVELADEFHKAGIKLIQIGGATDRRMNYCDGAILENFMPSQWSKILPLGRALLGVDSWTAHFGAILDIPQICLYGSTHPKHVNTKKWFVEQSSVCLTLGPIVNCSPCNSLTCLSFPERDYCTGYAVDRDALRTFLSNSARMDAQAARH
ncbi:hypothetical protein PQR12_13465 [Paraburkholderia nemoris]|uniref:glycosyltransferase family 9 protein n=1 Tax=Paraburkholderia nemoris TaxID=2793076 RepID=UPI0038BC6896